MASPTPASDARSSAPDRNAMSRHSLSPLIADWKRYLCRRCGIKFQRGFFDHRIRDTENFNAQCQYVRENPVRAGLVRRPEDCLWFYPRI
jgi:hypothetical protein